MFDITKIAPQYFFTILLMLSTAEVWLAVRADKRDRKKEQQEKEKQERERRERNQ